MGSVKVGGDPENYMDPPQLTKSDTPGGVGFIASVLNLLGVGESVAKEKPGDAVKPESPTGTTQSIAHETSHSSTLPALASAESAFAPVMPTDWGKRYLDSIKPIQTIDPNSAF